MIANTPSIQRVGESILHDDYYGLYDFFCDIWESSHTYVVLIARRCLNLNEIFMQVHTSRNGVVRNKDRLISNNALLLYADEIAGYYANWGRFPSILLADDMIYHGRGIMMLLHSLEELIVDSLQSFQEGEKLSKEARYYVHRDLASAVEIRAFGVNRQPLLIDDLFAQNLVKTTVRDTSELRRLSQNISSFIQHIGEPYTSYVLSCSVWLPPDIQPRNWASQQWMYRGAKQEIFFHLGSGLHDCANFLPTIRLRRKYDDVTQSDVTLTSLAAFGAISTDAVDTLCEKILEELSNQVFKFELQTIPRILKQSKPLCQKPRTQFLSLLLSTVGLHCFLSDPGFQEKNLRTDFFSSLVKKDTEKVSRNFACVHVIQDELNVLFENRDIWDSLENTLYTGFRKNAKPFLRAVPIEAQSYSKDEIRSTNQVAEHLFYDIGMNSEESAWQIIDSRKRFCPERPDPDMISLSRYMAEIYRCETGKISEARFLRCMLSQMDNGLISMNVELSRRLSEEGASTEIQCALKAGELATFVLPRYYHLFIPALSLVERYSGQLSLDRLSAVKQFIETLPEDPPDFPASGEGLDADIQEERTVLQELKRSGAHFAERLYACGQSLSGWDIDLVTADDWRDGGKGSYLSFVKHNRARCRVYLNLANDFLEKCKEVYRHTQSVPLCF